MSKFNFNTGNLKGSIESVKSQNRGLEVQKLFATIELKKKSPNQRKNQEPIKNFELREDI